MILKAFCCCSYRVRKTEVMQLQVNQLPTQFMKLLEQTVLDFYMGFGIRNGYRLCYFAIAKWKSKHDSNKVHDFVF